MLLRRIPVLCSSLATRSFIHLISVCSFKLVSDKSSVSVCCSVGIRTPLCISLVGWHWSSTCTVLYLLSVLPVSSVCYAVWISSLSRVSSWGCYHVPFTPLLSCSASVGPKERISTFAIRDSCSCNICCMSIGSHCVAHICVLLHVLFYTLHYSRDCGLSCALQSNCWLHVCSILSVTFQNQRASRVMIKLSICCFIAMSLPVLSVICLH